MAWPFNTNNAPALLWELTTSHLERRIEWAEHALFNKNYPSKREFKVLTAYLAHLKQELENRWDETYRQLVNVMLEGKGFIDLVLVMADRLEDMGGAANEEKAIALRKWHDKQTGRREFSG